MSEKITWDVRRGVFIHDAPDGPVAAARRRMGMSFLLARLRRRLSRRATDSAHKRMRAFLSDPK